MYRINEMFESLQGEGLYVGIPAVFIRLQGCSVGCAWCDTQHTWSVYLAEQCSLKQLADKQQPASTWAQANVEEIYAHYKLHGWNARHIVITGGEPCDYDLLPLTTFLEQHGKFCQIETSGTAPISCSEKTWVTLSPKIGMRGGKQVLASAMARANEIKYPVARERDITDFEALLADYPDAQHLPISLQPVSQKPQATELCLQTCIQRQWRLSLQMHKYLNIE